MPELLRMIEIDMDRCTRTFGVGACNAALSAKVPHKCFGTFGTCSAKSAFLSAPFTLKFCDNSPSAHWVYGAFPYLKSVSQITATVNIAGSDEKMGSLGRRATVAVELQNAPYHDRAIDPYQAQRVSGAAQFDGVGYDPGERGSFFGKLKARWPHYTGRALRVLEGIVDDRGFFQVERVSHYTLTDWAGPDENGVVKLTAKDPLSALDEDKAVIPAASKGALFADIEAEAKQLTLTPAGVGNNEYPASGRAKIGSELVDYTRVGDVVTLVARGVRRSSAASHSSGDTFQVVWAVENMRLDDVVEALIVPALPAAFAPKLAKWKPEVDRWASAVRLTTDVTTPTGRGKLLGELAALGVSIFWDDVAQEVALKVNRPMDGDEIIDLTDDANLLPGAGIVDRNEHRLTEVYFYTVQRDPTGSATSPDNFDRMQVIGDSEAMDARGYGDSHIRKIFCRWFNDGADAMARMFARRLLLRFRSAPAHLRAPVSYKDRQIPLAAVARVQTDMFEDQTGAATSRLMQVISREPKGETGGVELMLQAYQYSGRYAFATQNNRPSYTASTAAQRARGMYACNNSTLKMSNGDEPYRAM